MTAVQNMTGAEIEAVVKEVVKTAPNPIGAMTTLREKFPSAKVVWVRTLGALQWGVWLQPSPYSGQYSFICDRGP